MVASALNNFMLYEKKTDISNSVQNIANIEVDFERMLNFYCYDMPSKCAFGVVYRSLFFNYLCYPFKTSFSACLALVGPSKMSSFCRKKEHNYVPLGSLELQWKQQDDTVFEDDDCLEEINGNFTRYLNKAQVLQLLNINFDDPIHKDIFC